MKKKIFHVLLAAFIAINTFGFIGEYAVSAFSNDNVVTEQNETDNETNTNEAPADELEQIDNPTTTSDQSRRAQLRNASTINVGLAGIAFSAAGNIGELGDPIDIPSGQQVLVRTSFGVSSNGTIGARQLMFRIELPKNANFIAAQNDVVDFIFGGPAGPDDTTVDANKDYLWAIFKNELSAGDGKSFSFYVTPSATGITPDSTAYPIAIQAYNADTMQTVSELKTNKIVARSDKFDWNNVSAAVTAGATFNSSGTAAVPDMKIRYTTSSKNAAGTLGVAFAKEVNFVERYQVPLAADGTPLVQITADNMKDGNGAVLVAGTDYIVNASKNGFITDFTLTKKIENADTTKELNSPQFTLNISGAKLDTAKIIAEYGLNANDTSPVFSLIAVDPAHTVTPAVAAKNIGTTAQALAQTGAPKVNFTFKNTLETGNETQEKNTFTKKIIRIGATGTSNTANDKLAAYPNDIIVYQLGQGFKNYQKNALDELVFSDVEGLTGGYNKEETVPVRLTTGVYKLADNKELETASLTIKVAYSNGTSLTQTLDAAAMASSQNIAIPNDMQDKVTSITYTFKNLDPNFEIKTGPQLSYRVVSQIDATKNGSKFYNTANMTYKYKNPDDGNKVITNTQTSSQFYFYKDKPTDTNGRFSQNKDGQNLSRAGIMPTNNEVVLFTITVENKDTATWNVGSIDDSYTYNLSAYDGTTVIADNASSKAIDAQYLSSAPLNAVVWDPANPTQVYGDQSVLQSVTDTDAVAPGMGNLKFNFKAGGLAIAPGQSLKITYTMKVDDDFKAGQTIGNTFKMYSTTSKLMAIGEFWWGPVTPSLTDNNRNKDWANLSGSTLTENPIPQDIIAFTLLVKNESDNDWDGPISINDNYGTKMLPYSSMDGISPNYVNYAKFNSSNPLNMGVLLAPAGFDDSQIKVTLDEVNNKFVVDFGTNTIKVGEEVRLIYTMKINNNVIPNEKIVNQFTLTNANMEVLTGRREITINGFAGKTGIVSVAKSAVGVDTGSGVASNTAKLVNGEQVKYSIDVANYHTRDNMIVHFNNLVDYLPNNMKYVNNSVKVYRVELDGSGKETSRVEIPSSDFTVNYTFNADPANRQNTITVKLKNSQALPGQTYVDGKLTKSEKILVDYNAVVDTESADFPDIPITDRLVDRSNQVKAFFVESSGEINNFKQGGKVYDDTIDEDGDLTTNTVLDSLATVKVANSKALFGNITKAVTNPTINVDSTALSHDYTISMQNYSLVPLNIDKVVDIMPKYETLDTTKPVSFVASDGTTYEAVYDVSTYTNTNNEALQRIIIRGYKDNGATKALSLIKTEDVAVPITYKITYSTVVNATAALSDMQATDVATIAATNYAAMYLPEGTSLTITGTSATSKNTTDDVAGNDWDSNPDTAVRYQTSAPVNVTSNYISPFVSIQAQKVYTSGSGSSETYGEYKAGVTTVNPGDIVAWKVNLGNSNQTNTQTIQAGAKLIVTLPSGVTYKGYSLDATGNEVIPAFVDATPEQKTDASGNTVLIWTVKQDIPKATTNLTFTIRTATMENQYATYGATAYFIPLQSHEQYFYHSMLNTANEHKTYSYDDQWTNISQFIPALSNDVHLVKSVTQMDVYGELGLSSWFELADQTKQATPSTITSRSAGDRIMDLSSRDDLTRFTMRINVEKTENGFKDIVMINRLPSINDTNSLDAKARGSEAAVRLVGNGSFNAVILDNATNAVKQTLVENTDYVVEYFFGAVDAQFTTADWNGTADSSRWLTEADALAAGKSTEEATAFRVHMIDPNFKLENLSSLAVSYDAKLNDYKVGGKVATNSFGYSGRIGNSIVVMAEPLALSLRAPVLKDRAVVTKILDDKRTTPTVTSFSMDLVGKDSSNVEQYRETITIDATTMMDANNDGIPEGWSGSDTFYELPLGLKYSLEEPAITGFETPTYTVTPEVQTDGTTVWNLTVVNKPVLKDTVTVTKVLDDKRPAPAVTSFSMDIVGKDSSNVEKYRQTITMDTDTMIDANNDGVPEGWTDTEIFNNLPLGLTYSVEEPAIAGFETPVYNVSSAVQNNNGEKLWTITVTNKPVLKDAVTVIKVLDDQCLTPKMTSFEMDIVGKDSSDVEQYRQTITMNTDTMTDADGDGVPESWTDTEVFNNLPYGLTYSVEEPAIEDYEAPLYQVTSTVVNNNNEKMWTITVTNKPTKYDDVTIIGTIIEPETQVSGFSLFNSKTMNVELVKYDSDTNEELERTAYALNLAHDGTVTWNGSTEEPKLVHGFNYDLEVLGLEGYTVSQTNDMEVKDYGNSWTLTATATRNPSPVTPELPTTGDDSATIGLAIGAIVLLAGTGLVAIKRRK
ncbi:LPXTG cell wall anchor domain-containing protein [Culicoidibacter larvae]|uniref:LPXTG cell wall anchor domain-containing protein n=1 Tax=Culicoidibacter larvae TaxID=2579976 RepID=A0A5R8QEK2_9FIRM|nr:LPXTG cell wall anchor domain-containing protein [Culicoidibacter larvae]TLG75372.1 LPXTG cell wall anchor domain-containing protein [Culicoidibacter larvae]